MRGRWAVLWMLSRRRDAEHEEHLALIAKVTAAKEDQLVAALAMQVMDGTWTWDDLTKWEEDAFKSGKPEGYWVDRVHDTLWFKEDALLSGAKRFAEMAAGPGEEDLARLRLSFAQNEALLAISEPLLKHMRVPCTQQVDTAASSKKS